MLRTLIGLCLLCCTLSSVAQDKIYFKKGDPVTAKVTELGIHTISYQLNDGPAYKVLIEDIRNIEFANGKQMVCKRDRKGYYLKEETYHPPVYGDNIISVSVIQPSGNGWQYGLAYERTLDKEGTYTLFLPVAFTKYTAGKDFSIGTVNGEGSFSSYTRQMLSLSPVLKVYPFGSKAAACYSVGPGLFFGAGKRDYLEYIYSPTLHSEMTYQLGVFMHNAINLAPSDNMYIGFDLSLGYSYYTVPATNLGLGRLLISSGLRIGYRF